MISVIVCSKKDHQWKGHENNINATIGTKYEYLRIYPYASGGSICSAYNEGVRHAKGSILVFVHEDVFFHVPGWGPILIKKFNANKSIGLIGVAGTQYLFKNNRYWCAAGAPFTRGRVIQTSESNESMVTIFNPDSKDARVVAVDGLFFSIQRDLFNYVAFDETTFTQFHFYDLDICLQINQYANCIVTWDILVQHFSLGKIDKTFHQEGYKFLKKYASILPVTCANDLPSSSLAQGIKNYKIKGAFSSMVGSKSD